VTYWREEPLEIDGVLEGSWGSWAIEVKTSRFQMGDLKGLLEFVRRNPRFRPLLICQRADLSVAARAGLQSVPWQEFLLRGPPVPACGMVAGVTPLGTAQSRFHDVCEGVEVQQHTAQRLAVTHSKVGTTAAFVQPPLPG